MTSVRTPCSRNWLASRSEAARVLSSNTVTSTCTTVRPSPGGYRFSSSIRSMIRSRPSEEPVVGRLSLRNIPIKPS